MKGKFKKIAAALAAVTVLAGSMPSITWADPAPAPASVYTAIHGGQPKFHKVLVLNDANSPVPPYTFTYSIDSPTADFTSTDPTRLSVFKGPTGATIGTADFASNDPKDASPAVASRATVTKDVVIDLTGVTFDKPGIYRYYITETGSNTGVSYDVNDSLAPNSFNNKRTLDVYVENLETTSGDTTTHSLLITDYIMYEGELGSTSLPASSTHQQANAAATDNNIIGKNHENGNVITTAVKSKGYLNYYDTHSLTIGKEVSGNQGSRDKDFSFTFRVEQPVAGTYIIDKTNAPHSDIPASIVISDADVTAGYKEQIFTLRSGESITIRGIIHGRKYSITEDEEDYSPTVLVTGDNDGKTQKGAETAVAYAANAAADTYVDNGEGATGLTDDTSIVFTNDRSGVIPTGIIMSVAPAAIVGIGVLAAIIAMIVVGKKRELEEE